MARDASRRSVLLRLKRWHSNNRDASALKALHEIGHELVFVFPRLDMLEDIKAVGRIERRLKRSGKNIMDGEGIRKLRVDSGLHVSDKDRVEVNAVHMLDFLQDDGDGPAVPAAYLE